MLKKYGLAIFFLTVYILSLGLLYRNFSNKISQLESEKKELQTMLSAKQNPALNLNDIYLFSQKTKTLSTKKRGKLYFDFSKKSLNREMWQVDISLAGDNDVVADAADLQLDYSTDLSIIEINFGDAFPLYPRNIDKDHQLTLTGISAIEKNKITYASPGEIFVTLVVKKKQDDLEPKFIQLNREGTKIFYSSKNILDDEKNFERIGI